jgi:hypothetical protein
MDREQVERCLERVAAYRASGQKASVWAQANGVPARALASWCGHSRRWQARLDGVQAGASTARGSSGFVAARAAPGAAATSGATAVRVEVNAGAARLELHWPLSHARDLAALLREFGR